MTKTNESLLEEAKNKIYHLEATAGALQFEEGVETVLRTLLKEKDKEKEEAVAEAKEELLARIQEWNQDRIEEWVKTCLTETFDNGRFWEAKETQGFLKALEESLTPDQLNNERE